jgi:hypothetical protein
LWDIFWNVDLHPSARVLRLAATSGELTDSALSYTSVPISFFSPFCTNDISGNADEYQGEYPHRPVSKVVALGKIASQLRFVPFLLWLFEESLSDTELACDFLFSEAGASDAEESISVYL